VESFAIACTTCQTQLRVRDRSAIGQILTCPKCGSMVLVEAPADLVASGSIAPPPLPRTNGAAPQETGGGVETRLSDTVDDPTLYGITAGETVSSAIAPTAAVPVPPPVEFASDTEKEDAAVAEELQSIEAVPWRRWFWMSVAAIAGVGLAVLLFGWASRGQQPVEDPKAIAKRPDVGPAVDLSKQEPLPKVAPETGKIDVSPATPDAPPAAPAGDQPADPRPADPPVPATPVSEPAAPDAAPPAKPVSPPSESKDSPPGLTSAPEVGAADRLAATASLREALRSFGSMLDEPQAGADMSSGAGSSIRRPGLRPRSNLPRPVPLNIDVDARLKDPVQQINFTNIPLVDFLAFVSDYSTIPISLDPDVLPWLGISAESPITVEQTGTAVGDMLAAALAGQKLGYTIVDNQLLVTRIAAEGVPVREVTFDLRDVAGADAAQVQQVEQLIRALIAPESWDTAGGTGTIRVQNQALLVRHEETVLYQVLGFCEKLRVARGLAPRSKLDPKLFQLTPRTERFASRPPSPVSLKSPRPERFSAFVRRLAKESNTQLLIDWRGAAQLGWNPNAQVQCSFDAEPLNKVLRALLDPMDLTYRIVDENTLLITSPQELDAHLDVEFYAIRALLTKGLSAEQLVEKVQLQLGPELWKDKGGRGVLRVDAPSQCLIATLPQPAQQALAKVLTQARP
jgi:hypothetical protein